MKRPRSGGDDPITAALARWEAAKQGLPLVIEAALALYEEGGTWEDAALALADNHGMKWPAARRWLVSNRGQVESMLEAMQAARTYASSPDAEDVGMQVARGYEEVLKRRGLWDYELEKRLPPFPKDAPEESS